MLHPKEVILMDYTFKIRFFLNDDARIGCDKPELPLGLKNDSSSNFLLKSFEKDVPIEDTNHLVLFGPTYSSEEKARQEGEYTKKVLILLGAKNQFGLDVGRDVASGTITEAGKEALKRAGLKEDIQIRNDKLGLDVYPANKNVKFFRSDMSATMKRGKDGIISDFTELFKFTKEVSEEVKLAAELYNLGRRSASDNTRLIANVSAVDSISPDRKRPEAICNYINDLIDQSEELEEILLSDEDIDWEKEKIKKEKARLKSHLGWFKSYSISQSACMMLEEKLGDEEYNGKSPSEFFKECYKIRNDIIHSGPSSVGDEVNLKQKANGMDQLTRDLILELVDAKVNQ